MNNPQNPQSNRAECRPPFVPPDHPDFETDALIFAASFEEGAMIDGKFVPGETGEWHLQLPRWRKVTRDSQGNIDRVAAEELERAESLQTHPIAFTVDELIELYQTWDGSLYILGRIGEGGPAEDGPFDLGSDHPPMQMIKGRPSDRLCRCPFWYIDLDVSSLLGSESQTPPYWGGAEIRSHLFDYQHLNDTTKYIQGWFSGFLFFNDPGGRFDGGTTPAVYISTDFASFARETMDRIRIRVGGKWSSGFGGPWTDNPVQTRISSEAEEWEAAVWNYINYIYSGFPDLYAIKEYSHDTRTVVQKAIDASWISVEVDYLVDLEGGVEGQFSPGDTPDTCPLIPDAEPGDPPDPEEDLLELGSEGTWTVSLTTDPTKRARLKIDIKIRDPDGDFGDTFWIVFGDYNAFISGQISSDPGYDPAQDLSDTIASFYFETLYEGMRLHVNNSPNDPQLPWDTSPTWHKPSANQLRTGVSPTTAHIWSYESEDFWTHSGIRAEIQGSDPAIQSRGWLTSCSGVGKYSLRVSLDILSGDVLWDGDQEIYRFPFIFKGWSPAIESVAADRFADALGGWWSTMPPLHEDWEEYGGSKIETAVNSFYDPNDPGQEPIIDLSPPVWADPFYANIHFLFEWLYYAVEWANRPTQFPIIDNPPVGTEETITLRFTDEFEFQITVWKSNVDVDFSFLHPDD